MSINESLTKIRITALKEIRNKFGLGGDAKGKVYFD